MTHIEELREAVGLLRNECMEHTCIDCPLLGVTCGYGLYYPAGWRLDMFDMTGGKDDE